MGRGARDGLAAPEAAGTLNSGSGSPPRPVVPGDRVTALDLPCPHSWRFRKAAGFTVVKSASQANPHETFTCSSCCSRVPAQPDPWRLFVRSAAFHGHSPGSRCGVKWTLLGWMQRAGLGRPAGRGAEGPGPCGSCSPIPESSRGPLAPCQGRPRPSQPPQTRKSHVAGPRALVLGEAQKTLGSSFCNNQHRPVSSLVFSSEKGG